MMSYTGNSSLGDFTLRLFFQPQWHFFGFSVKSVFFMDSSICFPEIYDKVLGVWLAVSHNSYNMGPFKHSHTRAR